MAKTALNHGCDDSKKQVKVQRLQHIDELDRPEA